MPLSMPTPTRALRVCAHCSVNITGLAMSAQNPRNGSPVSLCSYCANNNAVAGVCESCRTLMFPSVEMLSVGGRRYCEADDPTPRTSCSYCGRLHRVAQGLVTIPGSTEGRGRGRIEARAYCDRACATHDGVRFEGGRAHRPEFSNGVEIIPWDPVDESLPIPMIAGAEASFGMEIEAMLRRCPVGWEVHHDGSIGTPHNQPEGEYRPLEIVSPILYGRAGMAGAAGALAAMAQGDHFRRANNAGFHVHVGVEGLTKASLIQVFEHWHRWGEHMAAGLVARNRLTNQYCRSMRGSLGAGVIGFLRDSFGGLRDSTPVSSLRRSLGRISSRYDRYLTLNHHSIAKHGTVEFRLWSCSTTPRNILGWTAFCVRFVEAAVRLAHAEDPTLAATACRQHGVMRTGLRLLRADPGFSAWVQERWRYLAARSSLAETHLASAAHNPWGRRGIAGQPTPPPETPRPRRRRTRVADSAEPEIQVTLDTAPAASTLRSVSARPRSVAEAVERALVREMERRSNGYSSEAIEVAMREGIGFGPESLVPSRAGGAGAVGAVTLHEMGGAGGAGGGAVGETGASAVSGGGGAAGGAGGAVVRRSNVADDLARGESVVFGADFAAPDSDNPYVSLERIEEARRSHRVEFDRLLDNTFQPVPPTRGYLSDATRPPGFTTSPREETLIAAAAEIERVGRLIDERHETTNTGELVRIERTYLAPNGDRVLVERIRGRIVQIQVSRNAPDQRGLVPGMMRPGDSIVPVWRPGHTPPRPRPERSPPTPARAPRDPQGRVGRRRRRTPRDPNADQTE